MDDNAVERLTEPRPFASAQMRPCPVCLRANAPTRPRCLYCNAELPIVTLSEISDMRAPELRPVKAWERGMNIVLLPTTGGDSTTAGIAEDALTEAADLLRLNVEQVREMSSSGVCLPLTRTAQPHEAALIEKRLRTAGLKVEIVGDQDLGVEERPPLRVRRLTLGDDALSAWGYADDGQGRCMAWVDVSLLVVGRIVRKRIEVEERRARGGGGASSNEVADAREFQTDESVLDLYGGDTTSDSWRIMAGNFDYSCLGEGKGLLAAENFTRLVAALRGAATAARYDKAYHRVRHLLRGAWPPEEQRQPGGLRRDRPGRFNQEVVTSTSNEMQFTRYSRLQWFALGRARR